MSWQQVSAMGAGNGGSGMGGAGMGHLAGQEMGSMPGGPPNQPPATEYTLQGTKVGARHEPHKHFAVANIACS
jgi:striatin 1/3/4